MSPDRELERELRELGSHIEYPPTPDLAQAVRRRLDQEGTERPARSRTIWPSLPASRWAVAAAALVLVVAAAPLLSPTMRDTVTGWFEAGGAASSGQGAGGASSAAQGARTPEDAAPPGSEKSSASSERASGGILASGPTFRSLDQMVATADLVVIGTVTDVRPGEVTAAGTPEEVRDLNTVVRVDEVLKGSAPEDAVVVKTLELAYAGPYAKEWWRPQERVLLFLSRSREKETPGLYALAGINYDQTAYVLRDDDLLAASAFNDPLSERVASLSLPELRLKVEEAKARIASGGVKPLRLER